MLSVQLATGGFLKKQLAAIRLKDKDQQLILSYSVSDDTNRGARVSRRRVLVVWFGAKILSCTMISV